MTFKRSKWHFVSEIEILAFRGISPLTINNMSFDHSSIVLFKLLSYYYADTSVLLENTPLIKFIQRIKR